MRLGLQAIAMSRPTGKPDTSTLDLYGQTYEQIVQQVLGGQHANFQLVNPQEDWTFTPAPAGFIDPAVYRFVGQLPIFSATGTYQPGGNDMHQAYLQVLSLWNALGKGINEDQIREANDRVTTTRNKLVQDQQQADQGFLQYKSTVPAGIPAKAYDDYIMEFWKGTLDDDKLVYNKALETLALIVGQKNPGLKAAIDAATPPEDPTTSKPGFLKVQLGTTIGIRPAYIFDDPKAWADRIVAEGGGTMLKIQLSAASHSSSLEQSWAGGSAGLDFGFFEIYGARGGWQRLDLASEDKSVEVNITVKAFNLFEVGPDSAWYNSGLLSRLATQDDWNPPFSTHGGDGTKPVFGKGGVLPLVLTGIIAGYQPSIDIRMSDETFSKYRQHWDAAGGVRIGPFRIGGSGGHTEEKIKKTSNKNVFHVESNATYPFIMGITVANPGM